MKDVSFYLIHNNSEDRIHLRKKIMKIAINLNIDLSEIYKQRKTITLNSYLKSKFIIIKIKILRIFYNLKHKNEFTFDFYFFLFKTLIKLNKSITQLLFKDKNEILKIYNHTKIESFVTKKHIKAWKNFLKSKKEIMIIFEDDAVCKKDTEKRLRELLIKLKNIEFDNIFVDLAGGYKLDEVIPSNKFLNSEDELIFVKGLYTNTACSYLINRNLVKKLYYEYTKSKLNNSLPIDHLINKLGLQITRNIKISSIHFYDPIFTHGSFKGNIKSWQIY